MPDEALQVIKYTIEPQIAAEDKKKLWIRNEEIIRLHYTETMGSSLMVQIDLNFRTAITNSHETVQD